MGISTWELNTIEKIKSLGEEYKYLWFIEDFQLYVDKTDEVSEFGMYVYNTLINRGHVRDNLTVTDECIPLNSTSMKKIIEALLIVREEWNEEITSENIDDEIEDFSNYGFGDLVFTILYGKRNDYNYNGYEEILA